jgi:hypothetical protein
MPATFVDCVFTDETFSVDCRLTGLVGILFDWCSNMRGDRPVYVSIGHPCLNDGGVVVTGGVVVSSLRC